MFQTNDLCGGEVTISDEDGDRRVLYVGNDGEPYASEFRFDSPDAMYELADQLCAHADDWRDEIADYYTYGETTHA